MAGRSGWVLNEMSPDKSGRLLLILPFPATLINIFNEGGTPPWRWHPRPAIAGRGIRAPIIKKVHRGGPGLNPKNF